MTALIIVTATAGIVGALALVAAQGRLRLAELTAGSWTVPLEPAWSTRREQADMVARLWVP
ncbi:MAG: hypothetical protein WD379_08120 [Dehalococcoidia bacterium]